MKKLFLAVLLSVALALGGCVGMGGNKLGGVTSTIPNMQYIDVDFFSNGNITKVPSHIRANDPIWFPSHEKLSENIVIVHFEIANEKMSWVVNGKEMKVLAVLYGKMTTNDVGKELTMEFYIYDGKQYPTKVTKEKMKTYMDTKQVQETL